MLTDGIVDLRGSPEPAGQRCHPVDSCLAQPQLCRLHIPPILKRRLNTPGCADQAVPSCDSVTGVTRRRHPRELRRSWNVRLIHRLFPNDHRRSRPVNSAPRCAPKRSLHGLPATPWHHRIPVRPVFCGLVRLFFAFSATPTVLQRGPKSRKSSTFLPAKILTILDSRQFTSWTLFPLF